MRASKRAKALSLEDTHMDVCVFLVRVGHACACVLCMAHDCLTTCADTSVLVSANVCACVYLGTHTQHTREAYTCRGLV